MNKLFYFFIFYCFPFLLPNGTLVESQFLTLQNVPINTTALARSGSDHCIQSARLKLSLNGRLDLAMISVTCTLLLLDTLALLFFAALGGLVLLTPAANALTVVGLIPLSERSSVDLNNGGLGECVGTDQFVAGWVIGHNDHTGLASNSL